MGAKDVREKEQQSAVSRSPGDAKERHDTRDSSSANQASDKDTVLADIHEKAGLKEDVTNCVVKKDWKFWTIIISLGVTILLAALESTIVSTALPTIAGDLQVGDKYVWFVNTWFLTR